MPFTSNKRTSNDTAIRSTGEGYPELEDNYDSLMGQRPSDLEMEQDATPADLNTEYGGDSGISKAERAAGSPDLQAKGIWKERKASLSKLRSVKLAKAEGAGRQRSAVHDTHADGNQLSVGLDGADSAQS